jgi:hypothetical protein
MPAASRTANIRVAPRVGRAPRAISRDWVQSILFSGYNHCRPVITAGPRTGGARTRATGAARRSRGALDGRGRGGGGGGAPWPSVSPRPVCPWPRFRIFFLSNLWEPTLTEVGLVSKSMNQDSPFEPWGNTSLRWPLAGRTRSRARVQLQGPIARPVSEARPLIQGDANVHRITECDEEHSNVRRLPLHVTARSA